MTDSRNTRNTRNTQTGRTHEARARKVLTADEFFFYQHAGSCHDPKVETLEQGRIRGARELAKAEAFAKGQEYTFNWEDDWMVGSHASEYGEDAYPNEPRTCECVEMRDRDGKPMPFSFGCIDDADANYRRVVEAELALEAVHEYDREVEVLDAH